MMHTFRVSEDDYVAAMRLHARPRGEQLVFLAIGMAFCLVALLSRPPPWVAIGLGGLVGLVVLLLYFVLAPMRWRSHYRRYAAIQEEMGIELTDDGLRLQAPSGESRPTWAQIVKWRENDRFVLVYVMPLLFHVVPKSLAQSGFDIPGLRRQLVQHKGPAR